MNLPVLEIKSEALTPREHDLVLRECANHPVATCSSCGKSYRLWQLRTDTITGKPQACPGCQRDLSASIREHLLSCGAAVVLRSEVLHARAREAPGVS